MAKTYYDPIKGKMMPFRLFDKIPDKYYTSKEDYLTKAQTTNSIIAQAGELQNPMNLPEAEVKKLASLGITSPGVTNIIANSIDDDDDDDTQGFYYDDENIFSSFSSEPLEAKTKAKKPSANLAKLPKTKVRGVNEQINVVIDGAGLNYQYLGQFDGDTSFLDEIEKNISKPAKGAHLYRKPTGLKVGEKIQFEYYTASSPKSFKLNGANFKFKVIGRKFLDGEFSNFFTSGPSINGSQFLNTQNFQMANGFTPVGQFNPALNNSKNSFFPVNNQFKSIPGTASAYQFGSQSVPNFGFSATSGKPKVDTRAESNGEKGSGFVNVANGLATLGTAAAAVISALNSGKSPNVASNAQSNGGGDLGAYIASQGGGGSFSTGGGSFGGGFDWSGSDTDESNGTAGGNFGGNRNNNPVSTSSSKVLLYVLIACAVIGLVIYLKKSK